MALIARVDTLVPGIVNEQVNIASWPAMTKTTDDVGAAFPNPGQNDRSIQVTGTLGVGGTVRIEGSNIAAPSAAASSDWHVLSDPQGNALDFTTLKTETVLELTRWIRPRVTAGDVTTSLTVTMLARKGGL